MNVCPTMLSIFLAIVVDISVSMKPLTTSTMLRFWIETYVSKDWFTITGTR